MKKFLVLLLFVPLFAKAQLAGFLDGNMYDSNGAWQCQFLMDGNCYDLKENILTTRPIIDSSVTTTLPVNTPQTVYLPVYVSPDNKISGTSLNQLTQSTMLPPYTEQEFDSLLGVRVFTSASNPGVANFSVQSGRPDYLYKGLTVTFNGESVWPDGKTGSDKHFEGLTVGQTYNYQITYNEEGREQSVFNKSFLVY